MSDDFIGDSSALAAAICAAICAILGAIGNMIAMIGSIISIISRDVPWHYENNTSDSYFNQKKPQETNGISSSLLFGLGRLWL